MFGKFAYHLVVKNNFVFNCWNTLYLNYEINMKSPPPTPHPILNEIIYRYCGSVTPPKPRGFVTTSDADRQTSATYRSASLI